MVSSEGSTGRGVDPLPSSLTRLVSRPWLLIACQWTGAFGSLLVVVWMSFSVLHHRAVHNRAGGFP